MPSLLGAARVVAPRGGRGRHPTRRAERPRPHACAARRSARWPTRRACPCSRPSTAARPRRSSPRSATWRPTAARWSPTARSCRRPALDVPAPRLGQPALLAAARLARRRAGAGRAAPRRRDHRRHHVPAGGGPGHRARCSAWSPRPSAPTTPPVRCCDRLADVRGRAAARPRSTASPTAASTPRPQPSEGVSHAPKVTVARRAGRLGRAAHRRSTGWSARCTPEPGRVDHLPRRAARLGPVRPAADAARAEARRAARREAARARRHRRRTAGARRGAARRQARDARARLGPRGAHRARRAAAMTPAASGAGRTGGPGRRQRRPAARAQRPRRARRRSTRPGSRRWSCSPRCGCATPTPTSRCPRSCAATGCATATRRWPPSWATAPCAPAACSTP